MGCAMSACGGLTTARELASDNDDDENHYGERRANGKQGVDADECERALASINVGARREIDHETLQSNLRCGQQVSQAELAPAHNVRAGEMSGELRLTQRATTKRKRQVRSATTTTRESRLLSDDSKRKRTNNLGALLLAILSRGRRHSSTRIDVTRDDSADSRLQIANLHAPSLVAEPPLHLLVSPNATMAIQSSEPPARCESQQAASSDQLAMSRSTPTITLDQQAARSNPCRPAESDEVSLFTSMHQLCYEIINCKLLGPSQSSVPPPPLCLFVFGRPGSSRGELAFELVEHSPLIDFIAQLEEEARSCSRDQQQKNETQQTNNNNHENCPLYHYLDVSSLIVANIDARIREYNRLVAQTLRSRRQQLASGESSSLESQVMSNNESHDEPNESENISESSRVDNAISCDDDEDDSPHTSNRPAQSTAGSESSQATSVKEPGSSNSQQDNSFERTSLSDQFGLITLSTKQRSILQLKMIKYACCVTAKWVMHLLRREIGMLEERLARCCEAAACDQHVSVLPRRVYLVNLVPNQLSLFKTCLYLQQNLPLGQLRMSHWAVKFERRTNIRLTMNRERAAASAPSVSPTGDTDPKRQSILLAKPTEGKRVLIQFKRLSQIRLPNIVGAAVEPNPTAAQDHTGRQDETQKSNPVAGSLAANLLAHGPNEKLGPKYNDLFAQQFDSLDKLTRLRYNPTRNYNYSDNDDDDDHLLREDFFDLGSNTPVANEPSSTIPRDSCHLRLRHLIDFEPSNTSCEPVSPSSMSQVSSHAGNGRPMVAAPCETIDGAREITGQRLLISPCPSSVASDVSSALSYDLGGYHQRRQQLSPTHASGGGHFRFPTNAISQHHQAGPHSLKWAIELELISSGQTCNRWYQQSDYSNHSGAHNAASVHQSAETSTLTDCCLHVYQNQKRPVRSRSHASLLAPSSSATVPETVCHADHYYLVATRVAYATGKSQPVLEVKRLHKRVVKCSQSRSDLNRLRKLISKACVSLTRDLDTWLRESISDTPHSPPPGIPKHAGAKSIALITYTIRVDASKFVAEQRHQGSVAVPRLTFDKPRTSDGGEHLEPPSQDPVVQLLRTQPRRSNLAAKQRPSSARQLSDQLGSRQQLEATAGRTVSPDGLSLQLPINSSQNGGGGGGQGDSSTRSSSPRQRHVQFKLGQAPSSAGHRPTATGDASAMCDAQRRLWLRDNLFASSNESRLFPAMDSLVEALLKSLDSVDE